MNTQDQHDPDSGLTVVRRHDGTWTMGGMRDPSRTDLVRQADEARETDATRATARPQPEAHDR